MMLALLFAVSTLLGVAFFVFKDKQIVEESQEASNPTPVATGHDLAMFGLSQQLERDLYIPAASETLTADPNHTWGIKWELSAPKEEKSKKSRKKSKKKTKKKPAKKSKKRK